MAGYQGDSPMATESYGSNSGPCNLIDAAARGSPTVHDSNQFYALPWDPLLDPDADIVHGLSPCPQTSVRISPQILSFCGGGTEQCSLAEGASAIFDHNARPGQYHLDSHHESPLHAMAEPARHRLGYEDTLKLTTSLCLSYVLCATVLRAWVRRSIYGADDVVMAVAIVFCIALFGASYVGLAHGAGTPWTHILTEGDLTTLNNSSLATIVTFTISLYLSKCSVIAFLLRLTKDAKEILLYRIVLGVCGAIGFASILIVTVSMPLDSGYYWNFLLNTHGCTLQTTRWDAFTALDILTDIILLVLPLFQVWTLQMPMKTKIVVISAFYLRLPVIALSIGRLVYTNRLCRQNMDAGLSSALVLIFIQIEISYAIVASTFSALRAFTMSFNSGFGHGFTVHAGPESYKLSKMDRTPGTSSKGSHVVHSQLEESPVDRFGRRTNNRTPSSLRLDPNPGHNTTQVSSQRQANGYGEKWRDERSSSSERDMEEHGIVRETEYSVQHSYANDELPILANGDHQRMQGYAR